MEEEVSSFSCETVQHFPTKVFHQLVAQYYQVEQEIDPSQSHLWLTCSIPFQKPSSIYCSPYLNSLHNVRWSDAKRHPDPFVLCDMILLDRLELHTPKSNFSDVRAQVIVDIPGNVPYSQIIACARVISVPSGRARAGATTPPKASFLRCTNYGYSLMVVSAVSSY